MDMVTEAVFPDNATNEERQISWRLIHEIADDDFGFSNKKPESHKPRFCVRCILQNNNDEMCVIKSERYYVLEKRDLEIAKFF